MRCDNHITLFHFVLVDSVRKKSNKKQKTKVIVYISINKKRKKNKNKKPTTYITCIHGFDNIKKIDLDFFFNHPRPGLEPGSFFLSIHF